MKNSKDVMHGVKATGVIKSRMTPKTSVNEWMWSASKEWIETEEQNTFFSHWLKHKTTRTLKI